MIARSHRADLSSWPAVQLALLAGAVVLRVLFQALFLPAFEGPDEPQHVARVSAFADASLNDAFRGLDMDPAVVGAVTAHPCGPDMHRAFGCPPFGGEPASFNLLRKTGAPTIRAPAPNHENHQPPLYYLLGGLLLRLLRALGLSVETPEARLLLLRVASVSLVALALFWPLRILARGRSAATVTGFLLLCTFPGASEALARCSNDGSIFFWSAAGLLMVTREVRTFWLVVWLTAGPVIKLTAIPVAVVLLMVLWMRGRRKAAVIGAASALLVIPIQHLRGWRWGGTYELNLPGKEWDDSFGEVLIGLMRSAYTFLKTTVWLGNWSFFRAPLAVLILCALLGLCWIALARRRPSPRWARAHLFGAWVAAIAVLVFSVANRRYYGEWGGLGGWYAWGWAPWLALAANDLFAVDRRPSVVLLLGLALVCAIVNAAYYGAAVRLYG